MHRLHPAGGAVTGPDGALSAGLFRRPVVIVSVHRRHRTEVHRAGRSDNPHHLRTHLGDLLIHVADRQHQLGADLLRNPAGLEHRSDSAQQQHAGLGVGPDGRHRDARHPHRTHCLARSLRPAAIHAVHHLRGAELQVLALVHPSTRHLTARFQDREAVPEREDAARRSASNRQAELLLRPSLHRFVLLCTSFTSDFSNLSFNNSPQNQPTNTLPELIIQLTIKSRANVNRNKNNSN